MVKRIAFIAQAGLAYSKDVFDIERFKRIREISAEILSLYSEMPLAKVKLPVLSEEKNNEELIKMCFSAYQDKNWQVQFD